MAISLSRLGTKNLGALAQRIVNSSRSGKYKMAEEHEFLKALARESAAYDKLYVKLTYSGRGDEIMAADAARDKAFYALKLYLRGYKDLPLLPDVADAEALYKVMEQFGGKITQLTYAEETAQLKSLLTELDKPEHTARLTTLKLKTSYDDLKAKQKAFEDLYAEQAEANAELRAQPSASSARARLEQALRTYLSLVVAMRSVSGWDMLYNDLNEMVKAAAAAYKNDPSPSKPKSPRQPSDPKKPKDPKDPKDPKKPGGGTGEPPKKPGEEPKPKPGGDGNPDIHLPEE